MTDSGTRHCAKKKSDLFKNGFIGWFRLEPKCIGLLTFVTIDIISIELVIEQVKPSNF